MAGNARCIFMDHVDCISAESEEEAVIILKDKISTNELYICDGISTIKEITKREYDDHNNRVKNWPYEDKEEKDRIEKYNRILGVKL